MTLSSIILEDRATSLEDAVDAFSKIYHYAHDHTEQYIVDQKALLFINVMTRDNSIQRLKLLQRYSSNKEQYSQR